MCWGSCVFFSKSSLNFDATFRSAGALPLQEEVPANRNGHGDEGKDDKWIHATSFRVATDLSKAGPL